MVLYHPLEHAAFFHDVGVLKFLSESNVARLWRLACSVWLAYVVADLPTNFLQLQQVRSHSSAHPLGVFALLRLTTPRSHIWFFSGFGDRCSIGQCRWQSSITRQTHQDVRCCYCFDFFLFLFFLFFFSFDLIWCSFIVLVMCKCCCCCAILSTSRSFCISRLMAFDKCSLHDLVLFCHCCLRCSILHDCGVAQAWPPPTKTMMRTIERERERERKNLVEEDIKFRLTFHLKCMLAIDAMAMTSHESAKAVAEL
jgi:hypothetical protein